ncbi:hypothetical protein [Mycolicibacterium helvum]|nr:hypothetical protein [Mycolicibacterium helvum]
MSSAFISSDAQFGVPEGVGAVLDVLLLADVVDVAELLDADDEDDFAESSSLPQPARTIPAATTAAVRGRPFACAQSP